MDFRRERGSLFFSFSHAKLAKLVRSKNHWTGERINEKVHSFIESAVHFFKKKKKRQRGKVSFFLSIGVRAPLISCTSKNCTFLASRAKLSDIMFHLCFPKVKKGSPINPYD